MKTSLPLAALLVPFLLLQGCGGTAGGWPSEVVETAARLPVQSEGRVKPLSTWAGYTLLRLNHRRAARDDEGRDLDPVTWALDALFRPERARRYPTLMVRDRAVLDAVGFPEAQIQKKRDRYSFDALLPFADRLVEQSRHASQRPEKDRSSVEAGFVALGAAIRELNGLLVAGAFARERFRVDGSPLLREVFGGRAETGFSDALERVPELMARARAIPRPAEGTEAHEDVGALGRLLHALLDAALAGGPALFPPVGDDPRWLSLQQLVEDAATTGRLSPTHLAMIRDFETLATSAEDPARFGEALRSFRDRSLALAHTRGEARKVGLETFLLRDLDPFGRSLWIYGLAFLLVAVTWLRPEARWAWRGAWGLVAAGALLHVAGIVLRCVVREKAPISNLYDTVIFITAFLVLASMVVERLTRLRIAFPLAPILGAIGLAIANRYEVIKGEDTMPQLVAVLDTNFWLWTHVTVINMGYAGALLTSAIAHIFIVGRVVGARSRDPDFYASLSRILYGTLGFGLIFTVVGTILGGIWANESWGRFWGWDPKENGALMIVLAQLAILHGRLGGILKSFGIAMAAVGMGVIVAFSWWGVNLLGIGLHSYGWASGVALGLYVFYALEATVLLAGGLWWYLRRRARAHA